MELADFRGYKVRLGTMDSYVIKEITSYRWLVLEPGDVVMDVGANIGSFTKYARQTFGIDKVIAIEPDPENFSLLKINAPGATLINAAVVSRPVELVNLYLNSGINKGLHSTIPTRNREIVRVPAVQWDHLLDTYRPNKIKIDCEGAEYDFLRPERLPRFVTGVIIEYNLSRKQEKGLAITVHGQFLSSGWTCIKEPTFTTKAWATLACYERK